MAPVDADRTLRATRRFVGAPLRPQTYRNLLYLLLGFPLGLVYVLVLTVGVSAGLGLAPVLVGVPILAAVVGCCLVLAGVERRLARSLLGRTVPGRDRVDGNTPRGILRALGTDPRTWTPLVYLPLRFAVGTVAVVLSATAMSTGVSMLFMPLYYAEPGVYVGVVRDRPLELHPTLYIGWNNLLVGADTVLSVGHWQIETLPAAIAVAVAGLFVCLTALNVLNGLARLAGWLVALLLGDGYDPLGSFTGSVEGERQ